MKTTRTKMGAIHIPLAVFALVTIISADNDMVEYINNLDTSWEAAENFNEADRQSTEGLFGAMEDNYKAFTPVKKHSIPKELPSSFDAREKWPACSVIGTIQDQGCCNSCWTFGVGGVMSDRTCIHSNATINVLLSMDELLSCCKSCSTGCTGAGSQTLAWEYWIDNGLVTGGLQGTYGSCKPYSIPTKRKCSKKYADMPKCDDKCEKGYKRSFIQDKYFGAEYYGIMNDAQQIQTEIYLNGPVSAMFTAYEDFPKYKKGVYQYKTGAIAGIHLVKILGWGTENDLPYWLIANSWGTHWGDEGYFKIIRGKNECGIEEDITAALPQV